MTDDIDIEALEEAAQVAKARKRTPENETLYDADPTCQHIIVPGYNGSGIRCSKCRGWFCY